MNNIMDDVHAKNQHAVVLETTPSSTTEVFAAELNDKDDPGAATPPPLNISDHQHPAAAVANKMSTTTTPDQKQIISDTNTNDGKDANSNNAPPADCRLETTTVTEAVTDDDANQEEDPSFSSSSSVLAQDDDEDAEEDQEDPSSFSSNTEENQDQDQEDPSFSSAEASSSNAKVDVEDPSSSSSIVAAQDNDAVEEQEEPPSFSSNAQDDHEDPSSSELSSAEASSRDAKVDVAVVDEEEPSSFSSVVAAAQDDAVEEEHQEEPPSFSSDAQDDHEDPSSSFSSAAEASSNKATKVDVDDEDPSASSSVVAAQDDDGGGADTEEEDHQDDPVSASSDAQDQEDPSSSSAEASCRDTKVDVVDEDPTSSSVVEARVDDYNIEDQEDPSSACGDAENDQDQEPSSSSLFSGEASSSNAKVDVVDKEDPSSSSVLAQDDDDDDDNNNNIEVQENPSSSGGAEDDQEDPSSSFSAAEASSASTSSSSAAASESKNDCNNDDVEPSASSFDSNDDGEPSSSSSSFSSKPSASQSSSSNDDDSDDDEGAMKSSLSNWLVSGLSGGDSSQPPTDDGVKQEERTASSWLGKVGGSISNISVESFTGGKSVDSGEDNDHPAGSKTKKTSSWFGKGTLPVAAPEQPADAVEANPAKHEPATKPSGWFPKRATTNEQDPSSKQEPPEEGHHPPDEVEVATATAATAPVTVAAAAAMGKASGWFSKRSADGEKDPPKEEEKPEEEAPMTEDKPAAEGETTAAAAVVVAAAVEEKTSGWFSKRSSEEPNNPSSQQHEEMVIKPAAAAAVATAALEKASGWFSKRSFDEQVPPEENKQQSPPQQGEGTDDQPANKSPAATMEDKIPNQLEEEHKGENAGASGPISWFTKRTTEDGQNAESDRSAESKEKEQAATPEDTKGGGGWFPMMRTASKDQLEDRLPTAAAAAAIVTTVVDGKADGESPGAAERQKEDGSEKADPELPNNHGSFDAQVDASEHSHSSPSKHSHNADTSEGDDALEEESSDLCDAIELPDIETALEASESSAPTQDSREKDHSESMEGEESQAGNHASDRHSAPDSSVSEQLQTKQAGSGGSECSDQEASDVNASESAVKGDDAPRTESESAADASVTDHAAESTNDDPAHTSDGAVDFSVSEKNDEISSGSQRLEDSPVADSESNEADLDESRSSDINNTDPRALSRQSQNEVDLDSSEKQELGSSVGDAAEVSVSSVDSIHSETQNDSDNHEVDPSESEILNGSAVSQKQDVSDRPEVDTFESGAVGLSERAAESSASQKQVDTDNAVADPSESESVGLSERVAGPLVSQKQDNKDIKPMESESADVSERAFEPSASQKQDVNPLEGESVDVSESTKQSRSVPSDFDPSENKAVDVSESTRQDNAGHPDANPTETEPVHVSENAEPSVSQKQDDSDHSDVHFSESEPMDVSKSEAAEESEDEDELSSSQPSVSQKQDDNDRSNGDHSDIDSPKSEPVDVSESAKQGFSGHPDVNLSENEATDKSVNSSESHPADVLESTSQDNTSHSDVNPSESKAVDESESAAEPQERNNSDRPDFDPLEIEAADVTESAATDESESAANPSASPEQDDNDHDASDDPPSPAEPSVSQKDNSVCLNADPLVSEAADIISESAKQNNSAVVSSSDSEAANVTETAAEPLVPKQEDDGDFSNVDGSVNAAVEVSDSPDGQLKHVSEEEAEPSVSDPLDNSGQPEEGPSENLSGEASKSRDNPSENAAGEVTESSAEPAISEKQANRDQPNLEVCENAPTEVSESAAEPSAIASGLVSESTAKPPENAAADVFERAAELSENDSGEISESAGKPSVFKEQDSSHHTEPSQSAPIEVSESAVELLENAASESGAEPSENAAKEGAESVAEPLISKTRDDTDQPERDLVTAGDVSENADELSENARDVSDSAAKLSISTKQDDIDQPEGTESAVTKSENVATEVPDSPTDSSASHGQDDSEQPKTDPSENVVAEFLESKVKPSESAAEGVSESAAEGVSESAADLCVLASSESTTGERTAESINSVKQDTDPSEASEIAAADPIICEKHDYDDKDDSSSASFVETAGIADLADSSSSSYSSSGTEGDSSNSEVEEEESSVSEIVEDSEDEKVRQCGGSSSAQAEDDTAADAVGTMHSDDAALEILSAQNPSQQVASLEIQTEVQMDSVPADVNSNFCEGRQPGSSGLAQQVLPVESEESTESKGVLKTRRGVQRNPTGDEAMLLELQGAAASTEPPRSPRRGGRRRASTGMDGVAPPAAEDKPHGRRASMATRRGVQRQPTGDEAMFLGLQAGAGASESTQRRGRRRGSSGSDGQAPHPSPQEMANTNRRGVQRQPTGDETMFLDIQAGMAPSSPRQHGSMSHSGSSDGSQGGRAQERRASMPSRRGVQRQPTGDEAMFLGLQAGSSTSESPRARRSGRRRGSSGSDGQDSSPSSQDRSNRRGSMATRRGVQRQPTGDETMFLDIQAGMGAPASPRRRGSNRSEEADASLSGSADRPQRRRPSMTTRRGVHRQPTGDETMLLGLQAGLVSPRRRGSTRSEGDVSVLDSDKRPKGTRTSKTTRRGVQRQPTGDETLFLELQASLNADGFDRSTRSEGDVSLVDSEDRSQERESSMKTRRGVHRQPTGDETMFMGLQAGLDATDSESPKRRGSSGSVESKGTRTEEIQGSASSGDSATTPSSPVVRNRRGVVRQPTGDEAALMELRTASASATSGPLPSQKKRRGGRRPTSGLVEDQNLSSSAEKEEDSPSEPPKRSSETEAKATVSQAEGSATSNSSVAPSSPVVRNRRGLVRQATGDESTLVELQDTSASATSGPLPSQQKRRGGRRPNCEPDEDKADTTDSPKEGSDGECSPAVNQVEESATSSNTADAPSSPVVRNRRGLVRQATGDEDTLVELQDTTASATSGPLPSQNKRRGGRRRTHGSAGDEADTDSTEKRSEGNLETESKAIVNQMEEPATSSTSVDAPSTPVVRNRRGFVRQATGDESTMPEIQDPSASVTSGPMPSPSRRRGGRRRTHESEGNLETECNVSANLAEEYASSPSNLAEAPNTPVVRNRRGLVRQATGDESTLEEIRDPSASATSGPLPSPSRRRGGRRRPDHGSAEDQTPSRNVENQADTGSPQKGLEDSSETQLTGTSASQVEESMGTHSPTSPYDKSPEAMIQEHVRHSITENCSLPGLEDNGNIPVQTADESLDRDESRANLTKETCEFSEKKENNETSLHDSKNGATEGTPAAAEATTDSHNIIEQSGSEELGPERLSPDVAFSEEGRGFDENIIIATKDSSCITDENEKKEPADVASKSDATEPSGADEAEVQRIEEAALDESVTHAGVAPSQGLHNLPTSTEEATLDESATHAGVAPSQGLHDLPTSISDEKEMEAPSCDSAENAAAEVSSTAKEKVTNNLSEDASPEESEPNGLPADAAHSQDVLDATKIVSEFSNKGEEEDLRGDDPKNDAVECILLPAGATDCRIEETVSNKMAPEKLSVDVAPSNQALDVGKSVDSTKFCSVEEKHEEKSMDTPSGDTAAEMVPPMSDDAQAAGFAAKVPSKVSDEENPNEVRDDDSKNSAVEASSPTEEAVITIIEKTVSDEMAPDGVTAGVSPPEEAQGVGESASVSTKDPSNISSQEEVLSTGKPSIDTKDVSSRDEDEILDGEEGSKSQSPGASEVGSSSTSVKDETIHDGSSSECEGTKVLLVKSAVDQVKEKKIVPAEHESDPSGKEENEDFSGYHTEDADRVSVSKADSSLEAEESVEVEASSRTLDGISDLPQDGDRCRTTSIEQKEEIIGAETDGSIRLDTSSDADIEAVDVDETDEFQPQTSDESHFAQPTASVGEVVNDSAQVHNDDTTECCAAVVSGDEGLASGQEVSDTAEVSSQADPCQISSEPLAIERKVDGTDGQVIVDNIQQAEAEIKEALIAAKSVLEVQSTETVSETPNLETAVGLQTAEKSAKTVVSKQDNPPEETASRTSAGGISLLVEDPIIHSGAVSTGVDSDDKKESPSIIKGMSTAPEISSELVPSEHQQTSCIPPQQNTVAQIQQAKTEIEETLVAAQLALNQPAEIASNESKKLNMLAVSSTSAGGTEEASPKNESDVIKESNTSCGSVQKTGSKQTRRSSKLKISSVSGKVPSPSHTDVAPADLSSRVEENARVVPTTLEKATVSSTSDSASRSEENEVVSDPKRVISQTNTAAMPAEKGEPSQYDTKDSSYGVDHSPCVVPRKLRSLSASKIKEPVEKGEPSQVDTRDSSSGVDDSPCIVPRKLRSVSAPKIKESVEKGDSSSGVDDSPCILPRKLRSVSAPKIKESVEKGEPSQVDTRDSSSGVDKSPCIVTRKLRSASAPKIKESVESKPSQVDMTDSSSGVDTEPCVTPTQLKKLAISSAFASASISKGKEGVSDSNDNQSKSSQTPDEKIEPSPLVEKDLAARVGARTSVVKTKGRKLAIPSAFSATSAPNNLTNEVVADSERPQNESTQTQTQTADEKSEAPKVDTHAGTASVRGTDAGNISKSLLGKKKKLSIPSVFGGGSAKNTEKEEETNGLNTNTRTESSELAGPSERKGAPINRQRKLAIPAAFGSGGRITPKKADRSQADTADETPPSNTVARQNSESPSAFVLPKKKKPLKSSAVEKDADSMTVQKKEASAKDESDEKTEAVVQTATTIKTKKKKLAIPAAFAGVPVPAEPAEVEKPAPAPPPRRRTKKLVIPAAFGGK